MSAKLWWDFNRGFIPVFREAKRIVKEREPITHCITIFHKDILGKPQDWDSVSFLVSEVIHAVDALRFMGGEPEQVTDVVTSFYADYFNSFNAFSEV